MIRSYFTWTHLFFSILYCLCSISLSYTQTLDLTSEEYGGPLLRLQNIHPNEGILGKDVILNIRTPRFARLLNINNDGSVFQLEKWFIKDESGAYKLINLPFSNDNKVVRTILSSDNDTIVIQRVTEFSSDPNREIEIHFFDIENENIILTKTFPPIGLFFLNSNPSFILHTEITDTEYLLNVIERIDNSFNTSTVITFNENSNLTLPRIIFYSSFGDRIFFDAYDRNAQERNIYIIDRIETNWTEPREWRVFDDAGNELELLINDIVNNGRTILTGIRDVGLVLTHEVDGVWRVPESVGYVPQPGDKLQISENGKVITIESLKRITDIDRYNDLFVLIQNQSGQWTKYQVNYPSLEAHNDILLSGDGTKLYWHPVNTSSIPNALLYK